MAGLPEWALAGLAIVLGLIAWLGIGTTVLDRSLQRTAAKRPDIGREDFLAAMSSAGVRDEAAVFLWDTVLFYVSPQLTPHPDDVLGSDLPIDDDDWSMDWPRDFTLEHGLRQDELPAWPDGQAPSLLNYGRWLSGALD